MDRLRSRGIFSGKGLKRQQVRNGLWSEQSSRRTCGWGSCILAQHPSAGLDFVPQANSARKMRARSQGSPSFAQEKGQIIDGISLRCLPQNSVCRRTQGVKEGRGEMGRREERFQVQLGILALFLFPNLCAKKKPFKCSPSWTFCRGELHQTSRALPHHADPSFALSEQLLTKARGANRWAAWHRGVWPWLSATR